MSVEKQARRALRRMVFWRLVSDVAEIPYDVCKAIAGLFDVIASFSNKVSLSFFYFELDAAREYRLLTGVDMGVATDNEQRYIGTRPGAFEAAVAEMEEADD